NDEPPTMVEPRNGGLMPRYSASARTDRRLWVVAENKPSTSLRLSPQSSSARLAPCAIRSMMDIPSATSPRSDSATPTIAALPRLSPSITPPPREQRRAAAAPRRPAHARESARAARCVPAPARCLHPAHQAEAFVAIDQRNIERLALHGMHDRRGVDRSEPFTDAPFQPITASEGTKHARVKDGASRLGAELIGQLTAREMIEIGLERGVQVARHACQYPGDYS